MPKNAYLMPYEELRYHVGHKITLSDVWNWQTNREYELEIRCEDCISCEPLLSIDTPK